MLHVDRHLHHLMRTAKAVTRCDVAVVVSAAVLAADVQVC